MDYRNKCGNDNDASVDGLKAGSSQIDKIKTSEEENTA
jgi:hypothetical protein